MTPEEHNLIEQFLTGSLSAAEEQAFRERMESDAAFREKVKFEQQLHETLHPDDWAFASNEEAASVKELETLYKSDEANALKEAIAAGNKEYKETEGTGRSRRWIWYTSAAVLLATLGIFSILNQKPSPEVLYASYLDTTELPSLVVRTDTITNGLGEAEGLFNSKEYEQALPFFENALDSDSDPSATLLLYTGISYMELERYEEAENLFDRLIGSESLDATKGYWYKALLFLKSGRVDESRALLEEIVSNDWYNSDQAQELQKELP